MLERPRTTMPPDDMKLDLEGRLRNLRLPYARALVPLFEAVVNSLQSIEETQEGSGQIVVEVLRGGQHSLPMGEANDVKDSIRGFLIRDDGVGFNEANFGSFCTSDSRYKDRLGGRGVGRLTWLKAFDAVQIESVFRANDGSFKYRQFTFTSNGVPEDDATETRDVPRQTRVVLDGFRDQYEKAAPKRASTLAQRIVEHCLLAFRAVEANVSLRLVDGEEELDLSQQIRSILATAETDEIELQGERVRLTHLRTNSPEVMSHRLMFLANGREVKGEPLSSQIPHLVGKLTDSDGNDFWWMTLVEGKALDSAVNAERDRFSFPEDNTLFPDEMSMKALRDAAIRVIRERIETYIKPLRERAAEQVREYIEKKAPEYRHVAQLRAEAFAEIPSDLPDEKLDAKLHKIAYSIQVEVREQNRELLAKATGVDPQQFDKFLTEANAVGKASLAKYVVHRRLILEFLKRALERKEDGKYQLEETIHRLIFPLQKTSDEVPYTEQNLWVIDERLAYHSYLASDKPLHSFVPLDTDSKRRPDLAIFNRRIALTEEEQPYGSIVLIEFKRPARDAYSDDGDPINQLYGYVRRIRSGEEKSRTGRPIIAPNHIPFYCYLICDITPSLKEIAENKDFVVTPDHQGYFGFNSKLSTYVEIISFDKLLGDAEKRNRMLFEKLNMQS